MTEHAPELEVTDARQARRGRHAFVILVASLALVVIALAAVFFAHANKLSGRGGETTAPAQVAQSVDTVPSNAKQTAATAPPGSVAAQTASQGYNQSAGG